MVDSPNDVACMGMQHNTCPVCRHELEVDAEALAAYQRQQEQLRAEHIQTITGQGGDGAQAIAGDPNILIKSSLPQSSHQINIHQRTSPYRIITRSIPLLDLELPSNDFIS